LLNDIIASSNSDILSNESLDFDTTMHVDDIANKELMMYDSENDTDSETSSQGSFYSATPPPLRRFITLQQKTDAVSFWNSSKNKKHLAFSAVQNRFKYLQFESQLYQWEKDINYTKNHKEKLKEVWNYTLKTFQNLRDANITVRDDEIRIIAIRRARQIKLDNFKACDSWVYSFKKENGIVSRKITKFVTYSHITKAEELNKNAKEFVHSVTDLCAKDNYQYNQLYNTDQSGFNLE
ncbi:golgin subfamily A member 1-like protein, partial [Leptotrombidium deliense]